MSDINVQTFQGKVNISNNLKVGSGHLFVDTLNNQVGLNTNTPLANLHVNGNTYVNTDLRVGSKLLIDSGASDSNVLVVTGGNIKADYLHGDGSNIQNITSSQWTTVNTNELYYDVGNVGIGNQNPSTTLDVTGTSSFSDDLTVGTDKLFVDVSAGRVGVGTVAPGYTLDIAGDINFTGNLTQNGSAYGGSGGSGGGVWQAGTGTKIYYSAGNVGVANTDPDHTLSVGSNLYVDDAGSNVLVVDGNVAANQITLGQFEIVPSYGLDDVVNESNTTTNTVHLSNVTTGVITTSNALIGGELTVTGNMVTSSNITVTGNVVVDDNLYLTSNAKLLVNSNTVVEHAGPHGRLPKTVPLKKYPEIVFEEGKFDSNDSTNTYVQAGYTVTASSILDSTRQPWEAFNGLYGDDVDGWFSQSGYGGADNAYSGSANLGSDSGGPAFANEDKGEWLKLEMPHKLTMTHIKIYASGSTRTVHAPEDFKIWGSNNNTNWTEILSETGAAPTVTGSTYNADTTTTAYKYFALVTTKLVNNNSHCDIGELEIYGYEEDPPAGDTSVDTTFTSIMNTPQTTGANVYVDGNLGETFTNRVTGPTPTGTATTYNETGKYWELTGALTSNVTLEANTFLEGDAPHSVSVWFNSSNLEANVSNTCVFSISDQEKLDSVNLDLQSNTWHNLTYAYQGEGGSRVTYLDGRKVSEDQAEDTFGDYPPFAMTGYSQGGYVVSASDEEPNYNAWKAFSDVNTNADAWVTDFTENRYDVSNGEATTNTPLFEGAHGDWIQIQLPYKVKLDYIFIDPRRVAHAKTPEASPGDGRIFGSTDGTNWTLITSFSDRTYGGDASNENATAEIVTTPTDTCYNYYRLQVTKRAGQNGTDKYVAIGELKFYGHRENDLVRLPDPTNVLKYPHIAMTGPAQRGYVASASSTAVYDASLAPKNAFNGIISPSSATASWQSLEDGYNSTTPYNYKASSPHTSSLSTSTTQYNGEWLSLETPHKIKIQSYKLYTNSDVSNYRADSLVLLGSDTTTNGSWNLLHTETSATYTNDVYTATVNSNTSYKYHRLLFESLSGNGGEVYINELEFYGTGVDSIPIQIGGGNIDKVANFRVYDKFVGEDQALEIWDAQKDEFGRAKSSMTLQKGRLGIGTTEPEGRLAVVDEPHNLEEFPPRPMTGYKNYFEGHGEFCVSASSYYSSSLKPFNAFNKITTSGTSPWISDGNPDTFDTVTGLASTANSFEGTSGPWIKLELPYNVKPKKVQMFMRTTSESTSARRSKSGIVYGRKDGVYHQITNFDFGSTDKDIPLEELNLNTHDFYSEFVLQITSMYLTGISTDAIAIKGINFFGTREQGQSVLHDGQLTLTKNLNVPRIGPALDADDTPRRDRLVVEYNTSTNPTFEGAVRDTSGRGNDGVFVGTASYDATQKSLEFPSNPTTGSTSGTYDSIFAGDIFKQKITQHTTSLWLKPNSMDAWEQIVAFGQAADVVHEGLWISGNDTLAVHTEGANPTQQYHYNIGNSNGRWIHVTLVRNSLTFGDHILYVNGTSLTPTTTAGGTGTMSIPEESNLRIGGRLFGNNYWLDGSISQFKLYDTVLTAEEVKTLYDMGRTGHIVNPQPLHITAPLYLPSTTFPNYKFYEEGEFVPVFGAVTAPTYTEQFGRYTKIGNVVFVHIMITYSGLNTLDASGVHIGGIPFHTDGTNTNCALVSYHGDFHNMFSPVNGAGARVDGDTLLLSHSSDGNYVNYNECIAAGRLNMVAQYFIP